MSRHLLRCFLLAVMPAALLTACARVRSVPVFGGPAEPAASSPARAEMRPRSGLEVIGAMRRAHPSRDLRSVAFTVTTTNLAAKTPRPVEARAVASLPGRFRITTLPVSRKTAVVRNHQRLAVFERGRRVTSLNRIDIATLLAYDVFAQGIDSTIRALDVANVRFGLVRRDRLDGRTVWVVGAEDGDTSSAQFWVDADDWRVVRVIQPDPRSPRQLLDTRFLEFTEVLQVPIPTRIDVYRGGKLHEQQVISAVRINPTVPASAFDVSRWRDVRLTN